MYGTQTVANHSHFARLFENDVKMYGTQTQPIYEIFLTEFENDGKSSNMGTGYEKSPHFAGIEKIL